MNRWKKQPKKEGLYMVAYLEEGRDYPMYSQAGVTFSNDGTVLLTFPAGTMHKQFRVLAYHKIDEFKFKK